MAGHVTIATPIDDEDERDRAPAYDARLLARLWPFVRPHRRHLFAALLMLPLSAGFNLVQPYLVKLAIDRAVVPGRPALLPLLAGAILAALLLERLAQFGETLLMQICGQRAMHDLRVAAHRHLLSLRSAFFDRSPVGKLVSRVTNDVESIGEAFNMGLVSVVGDILTLVGIVAVMLWLSWPLALVAFAVLPVLIVVVEVFRRLLRTAHRVIRRRIAEINGSLQEHLGGMNVVQIFGLEHQAMGRFDEANRAHRDGYRSAILYDAALFALVEMLGSITVGLILWYGGLRVLEGTVTFGLLVAFIEYVHKFFIPIRDLSAKYTVMQQAMASSERVFQLLSTDEPEGGTLPNSDGNPPVPMLSSARRSASEKVPLVRFESVSFAYASGPPVLCDLSFSVERGESLAIVGATGAGKSTVVRLLSRLYEAGSGRIFLDGQDLRTLSVPELRRRVVVVSQDVFLFAGTVAENISLDDPTVSAEMVQQAAHRVGLPRLLALDHAVSEQGRNLSGGERQLVAFARALARDPEVLVLDEATASIDPDSERIVQHGVAELMRGRTSIVVAHRLSTIEQVDRILVLHRGRLEEEGRHQVLLDRGGRYARLHRLQYVKTGSPLERG